MVLVFVGFLVWFAGSPGFTSRIVGLDLPRWPQDDPPLGLFFVPAACGVLALVSGFVFPRGFYLWGVALGLHGPFVEGLTVHLMYRDGIELVGGTPGIASFVVISAVLLLFQILLYTLLSSAGAGARYLPGWLASR